MNNIQVFNYNTNHEVRVIEQDGETWFVAKDVCEVLGVANARDAIRPLDDDEKADVEISDGSQNRHMNAISESGLYALVMRSNKPEAKRFSKWVRSEVLPSIRKHGFYATPQTAEQILNNPDTFIKILTALKEERAKVKELEDACYQWQAENNALADKINENRPKVIFAESVEASEGSILIGELAKILRQRGINVGEIRLFRWMRENGFLCKARGEDWNLPTQRSMEAGYFKIKKTAVNDPNRGAIIRRTPKVTGKGQIYFINGFIEGRFKI